MTLKCDLQYGKGDASYKLTRVGVRNVRKPVVVHREGLGETLNNTLSCAIDIYVDLPADQKGSHMSSSTSLRDFSFLRSSMSAAEAITTVQ